MKTKFPFANRIASLCTAAALLGVAGGQEPPPSAAPGTAPAASDEGVIADAIRSAEAAARRVKDQAGRAVALEALHRVGPDKALAGVSATDTLRGMNRITQRGNSFGDALQQREEMRQLDAAARDPQYTPDQQAVARSLAADMRRTGLTSAQLLQARTPLAQGAGAAALGFGEPTEPPAMPTLPSVTGSRLSAGADLAPADLDGDVLGAGPAGASAESRSGALDPARAGSSPAIPARGQAADALSADAVDGLPNALNAPGRSVDLLRSTGGAIDNPAPSGQPRSGAAMPNPDPDKTPFVSPPEPNPYQGLAIPSFLVNGEDRFTERARLSAIANDPQIDPEHRLAAHTLLALSDREPGRLPSAILAAVNAAAARPARGAAADSLTADGVDASLDDPLRAPSAAGDALGADAGTDPARVRTPNAGADRMRAARGGLDGLTLSNDGADAIRRALADAGTPAPADPPPEGPGNRWTIAELQSHTARMQSGAHRAVERVTAIDSRLATTRDRSERAALEAERAGLVDRIAWYNNQIQQNSDDLVSRGAPAAAPVGVPGALAPTTPGPGTRLFVNPDDPPRWDTAGLRSHNQRSYNMAMLQAQAIAALDARIAGEGRNNTPLRNQLLAERAERIARLNGHNHDIDANNRLLAQRGLPGDAGVPAPGAAPAPSAPTPPPAASGRSTNRLQGDNWRALQDGQAELTTIQALDARIAGEGRTNSTVRRQLQAERDQAVNRLRAINALIADNNRELLGQGLPVSQLLPMPGAARAPAGDDWRDGPADGGDPGAAVPGMADLLTRINQADHLNPDKQSANGDEGGDVVRAGSVGDDLVTNTASNRVMHGRTAGAHVGDANSSTSTGDPNPLGDLSQTVNSLTGAITNINNSVAGVRDIRRQIQDMRHSGSRHDGDGGAAGNDGGVPPAADAPGTAASNDPDGAGTGAADHGHGPGGDTAVGRAGARSGGTVKPGTVGRAGTSSGTAGSDLDRVARAGSSVAGRTPAPASSQAAGSGSPAPTPATTAPTAANPPASSSSRFHGTYLGPYSGVHKQVNRPYEGTSVCSVTADGTVTFSFRISIGVSLTYTGKVTESGSFTAMYNRNPEMGVANGQFTLGGTVSGSLTGPVHEGKWNGKKP